MQKCLTVAVLLFATAVASVAFAADAQAPRRPNIILVLADDLGYGDVGVQNPQSKIPTPHLDRLAAQGLRLTDAHSPSAVCTPTRYGILTGRYCWRTELKRGVLRPYDAPIIEQGRETLATLLKKQGYATACIGKWHLGIDWATNKPDAARPKPRQGIPDAQVDLSQPFAGGPTAAGFDYYFGVDVPNYPPYCFLQNNEIVGPTPDRPKPDHVYGHPGRMQEGWELVDILPTLQKKAVQYVEQRAADDGEQPFFLYLPLTAPHTPIVPAPAYQGKSEAGDYGDLVAQVDATLGSIVETVDRLGIGENTLIIFTSDNGSPARAGDPHLRSAEWAAPGAVTRLFGHNPNTPWRGMKGDAWEGGHRVPCLVRWTGTVPAGKTSDALVCLTDLFATIAALVEYPLPESAGEDSYNQLALLLDEASAEPIRQEVVLHTLSGTYIVRRGPWKAIFGLGSGGFTPPHVIKPQDGEPPGQLYNLADDPRETTNLWATHPKIVAELSARLAQYQQSGRSAPQP